MIMVSPVPRLRVFATVTSGNRWENKEHCRAGGKTLRARRHGSREDDFDGTVVVASADGAFSCNGGCADVTVRDAYQPSSRHHTDSFTR
jgi:hypothetical protein